MGLLDRLSGNGHSVLVTHDGTGKAESFDSWGRTSILHARSQHKLIVSTLGVYSKELSDDSYLTKIAESPKFFALHLTALFAACRLILIATQSPNPPSIFKKLAEGARAALAEYGYCFTEFPDMEYREGIYSSLFRYSSLLLSEYMDKQGDHETKLKHAGQHAVLALLFVLPEHYPLKNGMEIMTALNDPDIRMQFDAINAAIAHWLMPDLLRRDFQLLK